METYINNHGHDTSIKRDWSHIGITHAGMEEEGARGYIQFACLTHSGRADYIWQNPRNNGHGLTKLKADSNNYYNMDRDGLDDYIWVLHLGFE
ncbi:hypothetical protein BJY00DRAFT_318924 [Aspergillus carlsbadensis]|nr:hypothetical protein BJY00DRAFT_318924 [Aspergillus carlsbadensis]